ncbi:MAG: hypothetical protein NTY99_00955 [DPANN group archaeon]|nr:hypothetical protein [DPANN group archaeon]
MTREQFLVNMKLAHNMAEEIESFLRRDFRDFMNERKDTETIMKRYAGIKELGGQRPGQVLHALHSQEIQLYNILQNMQSHILNALADIKFTVRRALPDNELRAKAVNAEGHINSALTEFNSIMPIDREMFQETTRLKVTHNSLVGPLETVEQDMASFTMRMGQLLYSLRTHLVNAIAAI